MNLEDMYNTLPRSLKTELLTSSRVMEDPEELALRKELIATKTPKELSAITSLDEFPLPTKIETLVRKKKRTLKSTSSKESIGKRRYGYPNHLLFQLADAFMDHILERLAPL